MYGRIIINLIIVVGLSIMQLSLIKALPGWLSFINLIIISLIFRLSLTNLKNAIIWAIGFGALIDLYTFFPFGFFLLNYVVIVILTYFLLNNFFTNRSLYSYLTLTLFALVSHTIIKYCLYIINNFFIGNKFFYGIYETFWLNEIKGIIVNLVLVLIIFNIVNIISQKFKPVLLIKAK